jgi:hypothetical protein
MTRTETAQILTLASASVTALVYKNFSLYSSRGSSHLMYGFLYRNCHNSSNFKAANLELLVENLEANARKTVAALQYN